MSSHLISAAPGPAGPPLPRPHAPHLAALGPLELPPICRDSGPQGPRLRDLSADMSSKAASRMRDQPERGLMVLMQGLQMPEVAAGFPYVPRDEAEWPARQDQ